MRFPFLCVTALLVASSASAQVSPTDALLLRSPVPAFGAVGPAGIAAFALTTAYAAPTGAPAEPQGVYGVFQDFNFQAYVGATYFRFYELPGVTGNLYGFNFSVVYYPHAGRLGVDGEFMDAFAPQAGVTTQLALGMGGARFRVQGPRGLELWAHGLAGGSHFTPQTPYGGEGAFGFLIGGGVDLMPRHRRLGYRLQADMVGTRFFGTYQYGPKISAGIVYKF